MSNQFKHLIATVDQLHEVDACLCYRAMSVAENIKSHAEWPDAAARWHHELETLLALREEVRLALHREEPTYQGEELPFAY